MADGGDADTPTVKQKKSTRKQQQQAASGTDALRINLNTGSDAAKSKTAGLNI